MHFHQSTPTHTIDEFLKLNTLLGNNNVLYLLKYKESVISGIYIVKATHRCWYTVYIAKKPNARYAGVGVIYLISKIVQDAHQNSVKYIDLGISTENC